MTDEHSPDDGSAETGAHPAEGGARAPEGAADTPADPWTSRPTWHASGDSWTDDTTSTWTAPATDPEPGSWSPEPSRSAAPERASEAFGEEVAGDPAGEWSTESNETSTEESAAETELPAEPGASTGSSSEAGTEPAAESAAGGGPTEGSSADDWSTAEAQADAQAADEVSADPWSTDPVPTPAPPARRSGPRIELYLLRHADAGDPMTWRGPDEDRPLSERGHRQSERLGRFLKRSGFEADVMFTSPKVRAAETAKLVGKRIGLKPKADERLAYAVGIRTVEEILDDAPDAQRVVLVGHDPDFTELLAVLTESWIPMRKCAIVRIDTIRPLAPGSGELRWLIPPEVLKAADKRGSDGHK